MPPSQRCDPMAEKEGDVAVPTNRLQRRLVLATFSPKPAQTRKFDL
jgi:hypothetical protein